jgi:predicted Fe-Mo cluster-binding NifX family protein
MKIAVTMQGPGLDGPVDLRFGRASGFLIVDTDTDAAEYLDNRAGGEAAQGAGLQAAKRIADSGAEALVTGHCGPNAFRALQAAGIRVYTGLAGGSAREAVTRFRAGRLSEAGAPDVRGHWQ